MPCDKEHMEIFYLYVHNTKNCETRRPDITDVPIDIFYPRSWRIEIVDIKLLGGSLETKIIE